MPDGTAVADPDGAASVATDEGDEAGEYDRPKKPSGHQVRPIAGPGSGLRKVRGSGFGRS